MNKNRNFLIGIKEELKKVTFPSRKKTIRLTLIVFFISLITALYLGIIDVSLAKLLEIASKSK